jgi:two-component system nitrate/nitrite sensor histidine kinase NarX
MDGRRATGNMQPDQKKQANPEEEYRNIFEATSDGLIIYDIEMGFVVEANPAACKMHGYTHQEFIGLNPKVFMLPESYLLFREHTQTVEQDRVFEALVAHQRKDGSPFYVEIRRSMINYQGRPCLLSAARDVSQRIQTEKILSEQMEARLREQGTLLAISHTLASTLELQPGLILGQLQEILKYTHGGLFALEDSALVTLALCGTPEFERCAPIRMRVDTPETLAVLFNKHLPIRIADVWSDDPRALFLRSLLDDDVKVLLEGMHSWMWVPLAVRGRIIGGLGLAETTKDYFTAHHADLILSVANQAAITMINAEMYGHAQELAVLEERQSLARNLHDAVNQSLFSAGLIAEVLPRLWDRDQDMARQSLEDLRRLTRGAQAEMRALLAELRPSTLIDSSLGDLLHLLGNAFSGRTNIPVVVIAIKEFSLPSEVQVAFYRICQEALYNIAKHARASQVEIKLNKKESVVEMRIRDDGLGFDPEKNFLGGHYGLSMMRERAEAAQALLTITSQPGHGTELVMSWTGTPSKEAL